eukprot:gene38916-52558_t
MFGHTLGDLQLTQAGLADMATDIDASALLIYRSAWTKDQGAPRITREAAMAKMYATEAAQRVIDRAVQVFGFHLATVDLRQSSDKHEAVIAELLATARIEPSYASLAEEAKQTLLLKLLDDARPLRVPDADYSPLAKSELAIFAAARAARARYGAAAIRHYIISHTETVSDLLEALLLQKEVGLLR